MKSRKIRSIGLLAFLASLSGFAASCYYYDHDYDRRYRGDYYSRGWDDRYYDRRYDGRYGRYYDRRYDDRLAWRYREEHRDD